MSLARAAWSSSTTTFSSAKMANAAPWSTATAKSWRSSIPLRPSPASRCGSPLISISRSPPRKRSRATTAPSWRSIRTMARSSPWPAGPLTIPICSPCASPAKSGVRCSPILPSRCSTKPFRRSSRPARSSRSSWPPPDCRKAWPKTCTSTAPAAQPFTDDSSSAGSPPNRSAPTAW